MPTATLKMLARQDRISDRALTTFAGWLDEVRNAPPSALRPRTGQVDPCGLTLREKLRLYAAVIGHDLDVDTIPDVVCGLVDHPDLVPFDVWQILVGSDCEMKGTDRQVKRVLPYVDRQTVPIGRLAAAARALLDGDVRPVSEVAADPACGAAGQQSVARLRTAIDQAGAVRARLAADAYEHVSAGGTVLEFGRKHGIGKDIAAMLCKDARESDVA